MCAEMINMTLGKILMHAEHEIRNFCLQNRAEQVSSSIIPSIINEVLNLIKIVMHDEKMNTKFRTELPKIVIASP